MGSVSIIVIGLGVIGDIIIWDEWGGFMGIF